MRYIATGSLLKVRLFAQESDFNCFRPGFACCCFGLFFDRTTYAVHSLILSGRMLQHRACLQSRTDCTARWAPRGVLAGSSLAWHGSNPQSASDSGRRRLLRAAKGPAQMHNVSSSMPSSPQSAVRISLKLVGRPNGTRFSRISDRALYSCH